MRCIEEARYHLNIPAQTRKAIRLLTVAIWIGIFIAGLWPFNFIPKNRVSWFPTGQGMQFDGYGQVYSVDPQDLYARAATIELIFTPADTYHDASTVLSLLKNREVVFAVGQSVNDLYLQGSLIHSTVDPTKKFYIGDACERANELFVTVTLGAHTIDVYLNGQLVRSYPLSAQVFDLSGRILLGHAVTKTPRWSGAVARVAIFEGTLTAAEISRRYQQWARSRYLDASAEHQEVEYEFVASPAAFARRAGGLGPNLVIPKIFRPTRVTVLEWPHHLDHSVVLDAIINTAGFIPFGITTYFFIRLGNKGSASRCVATTVVLGVSVSLAIELLQVLLPTRDSSLADVITNIVGTVIGAGTAGIQEYAITATNLFKH
jgi:hypothetical protein